MRRAPALVLLLSPFLLGADQAAPNKPETADWSKVPADVRALLHTDVKQLPAFPESNEDLLDAKLWSKTRVFDGVAYALEYFALQSSHHHVTEKLLRSLSDIDSGWDYGAHYPRRSIDGQRGLGRGPRYMWYADGSLWEQSYLFTGTSWESRIYDLQGNVRVYMVFMKGSGCNPGKSSTELFGTDGTLVGFEFPRIKKYYWMGKELTNEEYIRRFQVFGKWR